MPPIPFEVLNSLASKKPATPNLIPARSTSRTLCESLRCLLAGFDHVKPSDGALLLIKSVHKIWRTRLIGMEEILVGQGCVGGRNS